MTNARKKKQHRLRKPVSAGRAVGGLLEPLMRRRGFMQTEVIRRWPEIVGPELARFTLPIMLRFPRGKRMDAVLTVRVDPAFAPLLQHRQQAVLDRVNRYFGYGAVAGMGLRQGRIPQPAPRKAAQPARADGPVPQSLQSLLSDCSNSEIKTVLERMGRSVYAKASPEG